MPIIDDDFIVVPIVAHIGYVVVPKVIYIWSLTSGSFVVPVISIIIDTLLCDSIGVLYFLVVPSVA